MDCAPLLDGTERDARIRHVQGLVVRCIRSSFVGTAIDDDLLQELVRYGALDDVLAPKSRANLLSFLIMLGHSKLVEQVLAFGASPNHQVKIKHFCYSMGATIEVTMSNFQLALSWGDFRIDEQIAFLFSRETGEFFVQVLPNCTCLTTASPDVMFAMARAFVQYSTAPAQIPWLIPDGPLPGCSHFHPLMHLGFEQNDLSFCKTVLEMSSKFDPKHKERVRCWAVEANPLPLLFKGQEGEVVDIINLLTMIKLALDGGASLNTPVVVSSSTWAWPPRETVKMLLDHVSGPAIILKILAQWGASPFVLSSCRNFGPLIRNSPDDTDRKHGLMAQAFVRHHAWTPATHGLYLRSEIRPLIEAFFVTWWWDCRHATTSLLPVLPVELVFIILDALTVVTYATQPQPSVMVGV